MDRSNQRGGKRLRSGREKRSQAGEKGVMPVCPTPRHATFLSSEAKRALHEADRPCGIKQLRKDDLARPWVAGHARYVKGAKTTSLERSMRDRREGGM